MGRWEVLTVDARFDPENRSWIFRREATNPSPEANKMLQDAVIYGPSTMKDKTRKGG